jgi:hypothetical protein
MAGAPLPLPTYITYADNVQPYIGNDKVLVSDDLPNAIPTALANQLVAEGEALALADIAPYYVTNPALITLEQGDWTTLQATYPATYNILYYMFVVQASLKIIGNFIARNTDMDGRTLSYFQKFYASEYNTYLNRITDQLANGMYRYQLFMGLQTLNTGIPRLPKRYAQSGDLGAGNFTDHQTINPSENFSQLWLRRGT